MKAATATVVLVVALGMCCAPLPSAAARGVEWRPAVRQVAAASTGRNAVVDCKTWYECLNNELVEEPLFPHSSEGRCVQVLYALVGLEPASPEFGDRLVGAFKEWQRRESMWPVVEYVDVHAWSFMGELECQEQSSAAARRAAHAPARKPVLAAVPASDADCLRWLGCWLNELEEEPLARGSTGRCVEVLQALLGIQNPTSVFDDQCAVEVMKFEENHQLAPVVPWVDHKLWGVLGQEAGCFDDLAAPK